MMYRIVMDSCGELPQELCGDPHFRRVPLSLVVDKEAIRDDETFDQQDFLHKMDQSREQTSSACPSPGAYLRAYGGEADRVYVVTLSGKLSGSYNSAAAAAAVYAGGYGPQKQIYVFNSRSASVGETLIAMKIMECEEAGLAFSEVIRKTESYIASQHCIFVLEKLDTLRKAGRISSIRSAATAKLSVKSVMTATKEGSIALLAEVRGMRRALVRAAEDIVKRTKDCENRVLAIAHCNCPERALFVKEQIEKIAHFKQVLIVNTAGVSSMYAGEGGVIVVA